MRRSTSKRNFFSLLQAGSVVADTMKTGVSQLCLYYICICTHTHTDLAQTQQIEAMSIPDYAVVPVF